MKSGPNNAATLLLVRAFCRLRYSPCLMHRRAASRLPHCSPDYMLVRLWCDYHTAYMHTYCVCVFVCVCVCVCVYVIVFMGLYVFVCPSSRTKCTLRTPFEASGFQTPAENPCIALLPSLAFSRSPSPCSPFPPRPRLNGLALFQISVVEKKKLSRK
jgi:hypothetical protein